MRKKKRNKKERKQKTKILLKLKVKIQFLLTLILFICLFVYFFICLFLYLSICLFLYLFICIPFETATRRCDALGPQPASKSLPKVIQGQIGGPIWADCDRETFVPRVVQSASDAAGRGSWQGVLPARGGRGSSISSFALRDEETATDSEILAPPRAWVVGECE